jgi:hypothetical protein
MHSPTTRETSPTAPPDFSLILGGPLYQLWRRTRLAGDALELLHHRVVVIVLVAWGPLLLLAVAEGHAWGAAATLPFLYDVETHARLLLALPLLIVAELVVHLRLRPAVAQFQLRGLVPDSSRAKFNDAIASAMRLRDSVKAEVALIAGVYAVGVGLLWRTQIALDVASWYTAGTPGELHPTLAGWWLGCVSLPIFQFLLFRWYFRLFIWARFLWQVSRLELNFVPTHPDRCGGASFLSTASQAFAPVLFAQGVLLAGMMGDRIVFAGAKLADFNLELVGLVAVMLLAVLGPLLVFFPRLAAVKRAGLAEYGELSQRYVRAFDRKWLRGGAPADEPLVGSADIQSLADLGNSFEVVRSMIPVPFTKQAVLQLAVATLAPVAPLILTVVPVGEVFAGLLKVVL